MKIDDALKGLSAVRSRETRKTTRAASSVAPGGGRGDSVQITPISARLSKLEEELSQVDTADTGKVEAVRQAIADGSFQVDEEVVADALVETTKEQLRRQGKPEK